jgi:DNA-binding SARP family transcriptional activator
MSPVQPDWPPLPNSHRNPGSIPELRLRVLGPPQITLGDVPLRFKRRKAVAMLAYLAMTGRMHTREALASLLARDSDDAHQASNHLRNTL